MHNHSLCISICAGLAMLSIGACSAGDDTASVTPAETVAATQGDNPASDAPKASGDQASTDPATVQTDTDQAGNDTGQATPASPTGSEANKAAEPAIVAAAPLKPPAAYAQCSACHNAAKGGANKIGPNLYGAFGSKAAQRDFNYSDALKNSGLTWDAKTLDKWLENPSALVPGTTMAAARVNSASDRERIIAYLRQQS